MTPAHRWLGLVLALLFLLIALLGLLSWIRNKDPSVWFWRLIATAQAGLVLLAISGVVLLATGGSRHWLHYAYGGFPILVTVAAHRYSKRATGVEWVVFALAGLVNFGLLLRGYTTGSGV